MGLAAMNENNAISAPSSKENLPEDWRDLKYIDEGQIVDALLDSVVWNDTAYERIKQQAVVLIETTRARRKETKGFQALMQNYNLSSEEGLALMCLAEALLRIPDSDTANKLIEDKIAQADFDKLFGNSLDTLGKISSMGLKMSQTVMGSMVGRLGMPIIRQATVQAMRMMGKTFVLGRTIEEALKTAKAEMKKGYAYSYDMLGEGARTSADAQRYFDAYIYAIKQIGESYQSGPAEANPLKRPGVSIKLSALHPRYDFMNEAACVPELSKMLVALAKEAARYDINLTMDAEEADRLEISLKIFKSVLGVPELRSWQGYGLAVQAYQKRAFKVIDDVIGMARESKRRIAVRLVKGAYWDSEVKHAQELGLPGYSVYTRKAHTDTSFIACAGKMLAARDAIFPMLGTHNAQTVASILEFAGEDMSGFAFQRLHGMGEGLYAQIVSRDIPCSIYAPVGTHEDLLAYLVRRLLENGANSSFVYALYNENVSAEDLAANPVQKALSYKEAGQRTHPYIPHPMDIYKNKETGKGRDNARGLDIKDGRIVFALYERMAQIIKDNSYEACTVIAGRESKSGIAVSVTNPADSKQEMGKMWAADGDDIVRAFKVMKKAQPSWNKAGAAKRAEILNKLGDLFEKNRDELMALLVKEAGKTLDDAVAELREAVDFCRYYADRGLVLFDDGQELQGPTGERNVYSLCGRGVFVCISPWNFPMAIYTGQIAAALMAGNAVAIKPAEQTPLIGRKIFDLMLEAGMPEDIIAFLPGDGQVGAMLVDHKDVAGVAFTGSTEVARLINRSLAVKDGPIVPFIAETGGLNVMIVDSTALPEQVIDDVMLSAFGSAGQRCSALRILCLQEDIAEKMITMLKGAMAELHVGDPMDVRTDIGPVIDYEAAAILSKHHTGLKSSAQIIAQTPLDTELEQKGTFFAPLAAEIAGVDVLEREVFGPILHVIRFDKDRIKELVTDINASGYGLTFGVHSRLEKFAADIVSEIHAGNAYVNRGMTGAVVGVQPFGGMGLSGTGPKAGGPYYLLAFADERSVSTDITASGGNTTLVSLSE